MGPTNIPTSVQLGTLISGSRYCFGESSAFESTFHRYPESSFPLPWGSPRPSIIIPSLLQSCLSISPCARASGAIYVKDIEVECERLGIGQFVSLIGRFWSLDREKNWDRIKKSYLWLVNGVGRPVHASERRARVFLYNIYSVFWVSRAVRV